MGPPCPDLKNEIIYLALVVDVDSMYSTWADWEPAATTGKCMTGVPGVFWRSPVVLWGPSPHNPT